MTAPRKEILAEGVELWLGDCRGILPTLGWMDAVVTDPPYGVDGAVNSKTKFRGKANNYIGFIDSVDYVVNSVVPLIVRAILNSRCVVVTPGNKCVCYYPQPDSFGAIYQPASVGLQAFGRCDAQPILYYGRSPYGGKRLPSQRCSYVLTETSERNGHPCPKPIGLMKQLVCSVTEPGEKVVDPFMGSGTTGVAAALLGRKFIGIERENYYFDIACRRISEALKQPDFFIERPAPAKQEALGI